MEDLKPKKGLNGHAVAVRIDGLKSPRATRPSMAKRASNALARIVAWIAIINILFRCPDAIDQCDDTSPLFCKQYFQLKQVVSPIVKPYYDTHAASYVDLARPYYDALDRAVVSPAHGYAVKYAAPRIEQGSIFAQRQWDEKVAPQITKVQAALSEKYDSKVAPHVNAIGDAASPYLEIARTNALQTYHEFLLPAYLFAQPYAAQGYNAANTFATNTVVPSAVWAFNKTYIFLDDTVLPQIRLLYAETVEPQLVRIGQRLGRYNGSKPKGQAPETVSATATAAYSSFTRPPPMSPSAAPASASTATSSVSSVPASSGSTITPSASTSGGAAATGDAIEQVASTRTNLLVQPPPFDENESPSRKETRLELTKDMVSWQEKFMDAAETGAREIQDKVVDICERMESQEVDITGKEAVKRFVDSLDEEISALKLEIIHIVETEPDRAKAAEKVTVAVRSAGIALKQRAQKIRAWRERFEQDLHTAINQAAHAHFDMIDNIKDLALQKMGMKWAWMDGVTYKDWKLYHAMKAEFASWRDGLEKSVVTHRSLAKTTNAAADVEDLGMLYAKDAALELKRLKEVGHWKVIAHDASDNFDSDQMRAAAEAAEAGESQAYDPIASQDTHNQAVPNEPMAEEVISKEAIPDQVASDNADSPKDVLSPLWKDESVVEKSFDTDNTLWSDESTTYIEEEASLTTQVEPDDGSMVVDDYDLEANDTPSAGMSKVAASVEKVASALSSAAEKVGSVTVDMNNGIPSIVANKSEAAEFSETPAKVVEMGEPETLVESLVEQAKGADEAEASVDAESEVQTDDDLPPPESSSSSVKPVMFGAAAQVVPSRQPIMDGEDDDEDDVGVKVASLASAAHSTAASLASMQYSMAVSMVSAQIGTATPKPIHKKMLASVSSAYSSALDRASSRLDEALAAASAHVAATPTANPVAEKWSSIEAIASSRLLEGRAWAAAQYESAKIAAGLATPTATSSTDKEMEQARYHYYAGLGLAQARYEEFVAAASSAISSLTDSPTPTDLKGTVSSISSVASESASSAASEFSESTSSAASVASEHVASAASAASDKASSAASAAGDSVAEIFDDLISKISAQVYGQPTPTMWYDPALSSASSMASEASSVVGNAASDATEAVQVQWEQVSALISDLVVGKEPPFTESVFNRLGSAYVRVTSAAGSAASKATDSVSSVIDEATEASRSIRDEL